MSLIKYTVSLSEDEDAILAEAVAKRNQEEAEEPHEGGAPLVFTAQTLLDEWVAKKLRDEEQRQHRKALKQLTPDEVKNTLAQRG